MAKIIKEIDWNGHHYKFTNEFKHTGTKSHDILTMEDENGNEWVGETTWVNRPWHRFDLEEAFDEIVSKAFGSKALDLVQEIDKEAHSVEDAIEKFFAQFNPEDITSEEKTKIDTSMEARRKALADYLEVDVEEIEVEDDDEFVVNEDRYKVFTDEEADEEFDQSIRNLWDELGLELVSDGFQEWILNYALNEDELRDELRSDIEDYLYQWDNDDIIAEALSYDLLTEEEAYVENEDGYREISLDEMRIDELREELINKYIEANEDNPVDYFKDLGYGIEFFKEFIDEEAVIQALKDDMDVNGSGRGQELAWYDGQEHELDNGFYAYQIG